MRDFLEKVFKVSETSTEAVKTASSYLKVYYSTSAILMQKM